MNAEDPLSIKPAQAGQRQKSRFSEHLMIARRNLTSIKAEIALGANVDGRTVEEMEAAIATLEAMVSGRPIHLA